MAIDERTRHELHQGLDEVLGAERAATLMSMLPPVGWADVATKEYVDLRFELSEARARADLASQTRTLVFALLAANATFVGLAFAAARLA